MHENNKVEKYLAMFLIHLYTQIGNNDTGQ